MGSSWRRPALSPCRCSTCAEEGHSVELIDLRLAVAVGHASAFCLSDQDPSSSRRPRRGAQVPVAFDAVADAQAGADEPVGVRRRPDADHGEISGDKRVVGKPHALDGGAPDQVDDVRPQVQRHPASRWNSPIRAPTATTRRELIRCRVRI